VPERSDETVAGVISAVFPATPPREGSALARTLQSLVATPAVLLVPIAANPCGLTASHAADAEVSPAIMAMFEERVLAWLAGSSQPVGEESVAVGDLGWQ